MKPVLYLDVDDTLLSAHPAYEPGFKTALQTGEMRFYGFAAPGAREFMLWALQHFEIRWLTWWCAWGDMIPEKLTILEREIGLESGTLVDVRAASFGNSEGCHKTAGIDWVEYRAGRPFFWVEDWISEREQSVLRAYGAEKQWIPCHVTEDPDALKRARTELARRIGHMRAPRAA